MGLAVLRAMVALIGDQLPLAIDAAPHVPMLLAAAGLAIGVGLFLGVVPAMALLRGDSMGSRDNDGIRTAGSRRSTTTHSALV